MKVCSQPSDFCFIHKLMWLEQREFLRKKAFLGSLLAFFVGPVQKAPVGAFQTRFLFIGVNFFLLL